MCVVKKGIAIMESENNPKKGIKRPFLLFNISILSLFVVPAIFYLIMYLVLSLKGISDIDFSDHSIKLILLIAIWFGYIAYLIVCEINVFLLIFKDKKEKTGSLQLIDVFIFAFSHLLIMALCLLFIFLLVSEYVIILIITTILLFSPYVYFIWKKRRIK